MNIYYFTNDNDFAFVKQTLLAKNASSLVKQTKSQRTVSQ